MVTEALSSHGGPWSPSLLLGAPDRGLPPLLACCQPGKAPPSTALPAQNVNRGPSRCTEKARQSLTAPEGWNPGHRRGRPAHIMARPACGHQVRPLPPRDRDEGRRLPVEDAGGTRLSFLTA